MTYEQFRDNLLYLKENFTDYHSYREQFQRVFEVDDVYECSKLRNLFYTWLPYIQGRDQSLIPERDLITAHYNRMYGEETSRSDSNGFIIEIGDYVATGYFVVYEVIGFSSKTPSNLKLKRITDNVITYRHCQSVIKLMDYSEKVQEYRATSTRPA